MFKLGTLPKVLLFDADANEQKYPITVPIVTATYSPVKDLVIR